MQYDDSRKKTARRIIFALVTVFTVLLQNSAGAVLAEGMIGSRDRLGIAVTADRAGVGHHALGGTGGGGRRVCGRFA